MAKRRLKGFSIVGMAIGFAIGISMDNWGVGIGVGVALATVFGAHERGYLKSRSSTKPDETSHDDRPEP